MEVLPHKRPRVEYKGHRAFIVEIEKNGRVRKSYEYDGMLYGNLRDLHARIDEDEAQAATLHEQAAEGGRREAAYLENSANIVESSHNATSESTTQNTVLLPLSPTPTPDTQHRRIIGFRKAVVAIGCRCRFCPHCCRKLGFKLKADMMPVLRSFQGLMMLTLTVDPKLFEDQRSAYNYVRQKRCIAELVKTIFDRGFLRSRRYAVINEFQKKTGMMHYHLLVESSYIPFETLRDTWDRFRPKGLPQTKEDIETNRPKFGSVSFSKRKFESPDHAANYVLKYLTKLPENGFPQWVYDYSGQIRLFSTSRGFMERPKRTANYKLKVHDEYTTTHREHGPDCFCDQCRDCQAVEKPGIARPKRVNVRKRLERCGVRSALLMVPEYESQSEEREFGKPIFAGILDVSFETICGMFPDRVNRRRKIFIEEDEHTAIKLEAIRQQATPDVKPYSWKTATFIIERAKPQRSLVLGVKSW